SCPLRTPMHATIPPLVEHFSALAPAYDAALCDVWGVLHNGLAAFPGAGDALMRLRDRGGTVVLISNAPRPGAWVSRPLDRLKVRRAAEECIVAPGDVTRGFLAGHPGTAVFHLGPERDLSIFDGLDLRFGPVDTADYVVCTGLFDDEVDRPEDYRGLLE